MRYFFGFFALIMVLSFCGMDSIYMQSLKTIDGAKTDLLQYKGKKMLFIILPLSAEDTTVTIGEITSLQTKHQGSLAIIGIPSEEAGFTNGDKDKLKKLYKDVTGNFIIAEGMKVKKGEQQSALFQWLTSKNKNRHFDQDVQGVGTKFFVDEAGELYAVMGPELRLGHPLMDKIVLREQAKKQ